jgi:hypothetical protein
MKLFKYFLITLTSFLFHFMADVSSSLLLASISSLSALINHFPDLLAISVWSFLIFLNYGHPKQQDIAYYPYNLSLVIIVNYPSVIPSVGFLNYTVFWDAVVSLTFDHKAGEEGPVWPLPIDLSGMGNPARGFTPQQNSPGDQSM